MCKIWCTFTDSTTTGDFTQYNCKIAGIICEYAAPNGFCKITGCAKFWPLWLKQETENDKCR